MIRRILKGAATVASLPVWIVGNALMVPLLKRQLEREKRRADSLATERNRYRPIAESAEIWMPRIEAERDEAQRKLNLANATVYQQIEALRGRDAECARLTAAHDGAAAEYQTLQSEVTAAHAVLDRTTAAKGTTLADRVRQHVELYENAIGAYRDDLRKVEGQLEALRSAALEALAIATGAQWTKYHRPSDVTIEAILSAALKADRTPPVQDAPPPQVDKGGQGGEGLCPTFSGPHPAEATGIRATSVQRISPGIWSLRVSLADKRLTASEILHRARVVLLREGDHPADPVTQQWAGIVEDMQRKRDEDTRRLEAAWRERDALKKELADADRDHDAALAERLARHHEVLKEREEDLAFALHCKPRPWRDLLAYAEEMVHGYGHLAQQLAVEKEKGKQ